jgi:hypothetical protein
LNADEPILLTRLTHLRDAIFKASDPVGSAYHGQIDAVKALMNLFEHSIVDNLRAAFTALEPPNPDFKRAQAALVQANFALDGLKKDHAHDAVLSARVELVGDLVANSQGLIQEHQQKNQIPVAAIRTMIHPTESDLARRLKVARAALG